MRQGGGKPSGSGWKQSSFAGLITKACFLPHLWFPTAEQLEEGCACPVFALASSCTHPLLPTRDHSPEPPFRACFYSSPGSRGPALLLPQGSSQDGGTRLATASSRVPPACCSLVHLPFPSTRKQALKPTTHPWCSRDQQEQPVATGKVSPGRRRYLCTAAALKHRGLLRSLAVFFFF